jgi:putative transposase
LVLTAGECHYISQAPPVLLASIVDRTVQAHATYVIADRAYDVQEFLNLTDQLGAIAVIPAREDSKSLQTYDTDLYKERHRIASTINMLRYCGRIFTRFDKLASRFLGFFSLASTPAWLHQAHAAPSLAAVYFDIR